MSPPRWHHALDDDGQPLDAPPIAGRRKSKFITPVPQPKKKGKGKQGSFVFADDLGLTTAEQEYNPSPIIDEIRSHLESWRAIPNPSDWGVTPSTARLLTHWRTHDFTGVTPFFCQIEAVETIIWLTEVASRAPRYRRIWEHVRGANKEANPELIRLAMKMATGAGKTTVMAMLIVWQTVNWARSPGTKTFSRGFLIITPGITIKDRLRVLTPEHSDSYYRAREILPADMLGDIGKAKIVITNYHALKRREKTELSKVGRSLLQGRGEAPDTVETEGMMLARVCDSLLTLDSVVVLNDEAHHCYREKETQKVEVALEREEREEAKKNNEAARLWISGIEALKRRMPLRMVYDLSATPFFLAGSGYVEGTLFPWVVSDFSLMDAIECGIVKLPRIPIDDNMVAGNLPLYRDLWKALKERGLNLPRKGAGKSGEIDPLTLFSEIQTALYSLYSHYKKVFAEWDGVISTPPVFIVVCSNTSVSKLVYEWISGWQRLNPDGEPYTVHQGHLELFRNFDQHGQRLPRPNTLLIDSEQLESGDALDPQFREMAGPEIELFKYELKRQLGAGDAEDISDATLLREVMNTVGKPGKLGAEG